MKLKHYLLICLCLFAGIKALAYDVMVDGIYYNLFKYSGKAEVTYYNKSYSGTVSIPSSITYSGKTYRVTAIGYAAFSGCSGLTSVTIPNSVSSIGYNAFKGCSSLTSITIPNSVTSIGYSAFDGCSSLTSITIPNSVTSIGDDAFYGCSNLTSITIPNSVTSIGDGSFGNCSSLSSIIVESSNTTYDSRNNCNAIIETATNTLISGCKTTTIPNSVTSIGDFAFYHCSSLTSIIVPESVMSIGSYAFYGCSSLTSIYIPNKMTSIGGHAFEGTAWYDNQPDGLVYLGNVAYGYKGTMSEGTHVSIKEGIIGIADQAFEGCTNLTSITIPGSVTSIGDFAFRNCSGLTFITIPAGVISFGYEAFGGCNFSFVIMECETPFFRSFEEWVQSFSTIPILYVPAGCKDAYIAAFSAYGYEDWNHYVWSIKDKLPESVDGIYYDFDTENKVAEVESPLSGEKYKGNIVIPSSVTYQGVSYSVIGIGINAFFDCTGLTSINIPNSVTSIGQNAFYQCSSLATITIPENVTNVGYQAFYGTSWYEAQLDGLVYAGKVAYKYKGTMPEGSQIVIKDGTLGIAASAFHGCSGLTSVAIPGSVTNIGDGAFYYCNNLTIVKVGMETPVPILGDTFSNRRNATLYVPVGCKATYAAADYWKEFKQIIEETPQIAGLYYRFDKSKMVAEVIASPHGDKYQGDIVIPDSVIFRGSTYIVTSIAENAFSQCTSLTSVTIPRYMTSISKSAFYGSYSSYGYNFKFYATRNTDGLIAVWNYGVDPYLLGGYPWETISRPYITSSSLTQTSIKYRVVNVYDFEYETNGESLDSYTYQITGLRPEYSQLITLTVRSANNSYSTSTTLTTLPVTPVVNIENITASSFTAKGSCKFTGYIPDIISRKITVDGMEKDGDEMTFRGLDPNTSHTCKYKLVLEYPGNYRYSCEASKEITTAELSLVTKQPKTISEGNVIVAAETNVDDAETNVGFEWRRIDWTDDFDSKSGGAYLFEGAMEGYIRSINSNYLWKFRPFYTSNAGNTYYGEWKGMDPSDYSYFEPTVHTYAQINVTGNSAEVKGYAMRGTDNVTSQGFMYWENNSSFSLRRRVTNIPDNVTVVRASGNVMTATLEDLEYETSYSYVAFMTTSEGETFYGEVNTFTTDVDPDGVDEVKSQDAVTEIARYDVQGRPISKPQKGINIIRYSDGSTRKVMVK